MSNDLFLGKPFNVPSYALLTRMIAHVCGLEAGELVTFIVDAHIYLDHVEQVKEQLSRTPFAEPKLIIDSDVKNIDDFTMHSFTVLDYQSHPAIKADMAV